MEIFFKIILIILDAFVIAISDDGITNLFGVAAIIFLSISLLISLIKTRDSSWCYPKNANEPCSICEYCEPKQDQFINKLCVSTGVCEHDKNVAIDKIRAEIEDHCGLAKENHCKYCPHCNNVMGVREILEIIDKYKAESEEKE